MGLHNIQEISPALELCFCNYVFTEYFLQVLNKKYLLLT